LRRGFERAERLLDRFFGPRWNPLYHLGALGFLFYWVVAVSGVYVYVLFDTGTTEAYESVEYMTVEQWYLGGVMRSLHRYASDALVLMLALHTLREFALGRFRGPRWFTWVTAVPIVWLVFIAGISGYWLVWDELAQYVAIATTEWLDWLGIFGDPIARNFLTPAALDDRFFTLLTFVHVAVPLLLLLVLWLHLQRVSRPPVIPSRGLTIGTVLMLIALSLAKPAVSHAPADLTMVPGELRLDWYYLAFYPLIDRLSAGAAWAFAGTLTLILAAVPLLPPRRRAAAAVVNLDNCNGCGRCVDDCPYNAVHLCPRSDGLPFAHEAKVKAELCVACGICTGACPTATPFRRRATPRAGIECPDLTVAELRRRVAAAAEPLSGPARVIVFACEHGGAARAGGEGLGVVPVPCNGAVPPSFVDYVLSRGLADGVALAGCREDNCYNRYGVAWTEARLAGTRDPRLRPRVPRERVATAWRASGEGAALAADLQAFRARLAALPGEVSRQGADTAVARQPEGAC
jgi:ferredoxin/coenzyme F420-reducing hydrogenase delta subunit